MTLKQDLISEIKPMFDANAWLEEEEKTKNIPDPTKLNLTNHAKNLSRATVLYADLDGSTDMVNNYKWWFSAAVYQSYLRCAARIIGREGGTITAYDGDRVMAIFTGDDMETHAVRAALAINWAVWEIVRPQIKERFPKTEFVLNHSIGIDASQLRAARIGVRGYNDLVWIGRAANYAAKLTNLNSKPLWITQAVYDAMSDDVKFTTTGGVPMWEARSWDKLPGLGIWRSGYRWGYTT